MPLTPEQPMQAVVAELLRRSTDGNLALLNGDLRGFADLVPHSDDYTLMSPFGGTPTHGFDRFPGCSRAFGTLERPLRERGSIRDGKVGRALAQLVPGSAVIETTVALLADDPAALLCTDPGCYRCSRARARVT